VYIDEQQQLKQELLALRQSLTPPPSCAQGHLFRKKKGGVLECERCLMTPFGVLREEDR
jgi:hypothetical protein